MRSVLFIAITWSLAAHAEPRAKKVSSAAPGSTGTLVGKIRFEGAPPPMREIAVTDPRCLATSLRAEDVVVTGGGLRDVVVRLPVGAVKGSGDVPPPALLDQAGCRYTPHVLALRAGQKVAYRNSDATLHNVHTDDFNIAQPRGAADAVFDVPTKAGDAPYRVRCDVHPWMSAFVLVTDHPHAVVTGEDGTFRLPNVPIGSYKLQAWHPHLGIKEAEVKVVPGKPVEVVFPAYGSADYKAPE